jgi:hypothetical protein
MAATYDPARGSAKDRVRAHIDDRRAPFRFDDAEIVAELGGESGEAAEISAAIRLLESEVSGSLVSESRKQGSWSYTRTVTSANEARIRTLRERLSLLQSADPPGGSASVVEDPAITPGFAPGRFEGRWPLV